MGMKEIENFIQIVTKAEAENLDKNKNVSILSELNENNYLVMYNGDISENIKNLYCFDSSNDKENVNPEKNKRYKLNKSEIKKSGINKTQAVPSAVHIAAAISSYARMLINDYKNIPGNPCIMSDTDSAALPYPLPSHLVGDGLGQMKLVHKIKKGIFVKKNYIIF